MCPVARHRFQQGRVAVKLDLPRLRQLGEYSGGALSGAQRKFVARMDTCQSRTTREQIQDPGAASLQLR
jgi:hypothetical protein